MSHEVDRYDRIDLVRRFFSGNESSYDRVVRLTTIGFDCRWKEKIVDMIPAESTRIADQACGTGILTIKIARRFPHARVIGIDVTGGYLRVAKEKAEALGLRNIELIPGRAEEIMPEGECDCVTSSYLAKYADLDRLVHITKKLLRPGGVILAHDFTYPKGRIFAFVWRLYFSFLQTVVARRYPSWKPAFDGLPEFLRETDWVGRLGRLLARYGFEDIRSEPLTFGTAAIVLAKKAP